MNKSNKALIIVDMQDGFLEAVDNKKQLVKNVNSVMDYFKKNNYPIYVVTFASDLMGDLQVDILENMPKGLEIYEKRRHSAFADKLKIKGKVDEFILLEEDLYQRGVLERVVCGVTRGVCLKGTFLDSLKKQKLTFSADDLMDNEGKYFQDYNRGYFFDNHLDLVEYLKSN